MKSWDFCPARCSCTAMSPTSSCTRISTAWRYCSTQWTCCKVRHVIVCGHYGCGGVKAALDNAKLGLIENWLRHVQDIANVQHAALQGLDGAAKVDRLCELNVVEQARHVCETTVVQDAWARGQTVAVHAWIYGLSDGRLRDLGFDSSNGLKERNHG